MRVRRLVLGGGEHGRCIGPNCFCFGRGLCPKSVSVGVGPIQHDCCVAWPIDRHRGHRREHARRRLAGGLMNGITKPVGLTISRHNETMLNRDQPQKDTNLVLVVTAEAEPELLGGNLIRRQRHVSSPELRWATEPTAASVSQRCFPAI